MLFNGKYLRVKLEKRGDRTFECVQVRDGVSVILITAEGKIRCIDEVDWGSGKRRWKLVSGYINDGENPADCAKRELSEELGLTADTWQLYWTAPSEDSTIEKEQYYFLARGLIRGKAHPDKDENIYGFADFSFDEVKEMALRGEFGSGSTAFVLLKLCFSVR
jgi:ADP-ribose pyrophosphatase